MSAHHGHSHGGSSASESVSLKVLLGAFLLTGSFFAIELVGGLLFNSLALLADASHMFSDMVALGIALVAQMVATRPATDTHSFGWRRVEVLAALVNGVLLFAVAVFIAYEAGQRLSNPLEVNSLGVMVVAAAGLVVNVVCTLWLRSAASSNINVKAAAMHTLSDALGSVAVLVAGLAITLGAPNWADVVASMVIAVLVVSASVRLIRQTLRVLLEATPENLSPNEVQAALLADESVSRVHHLHLWSLAPGSIAMSAHVELEGIETLHEAQEKGQALKALLVESFGVTHSTLELECHPCGPDDIQH